MPGLAIEIQRWRRTSRDASPTTRCAACSTRAADPRQLLTVTSETGQTDQKSRIQHALWSDRDGSMLLPTRRPPRCCKNMKHAAFRANDIGLNLVGFFYLTLFFIFRLPVQFRRIECGEGAYPVFARAPGSRYDPIAHLP
jgi:hypothetical protein